MHEFDRESERVTINILQTLSRFENVQDLPTPVVSAILMNDALRQRLAIADNRDEAEDVNCVREVMVEELRRAHAEATDAMAAASAIKSEVDQKEEQIRTLDAHLESARLALLHSQESERRKEAERGELVDRVRVSESSNAELEERVRSLEAAAIESAALQDLREHRRQYLLLYCGVPLALIMVFAALAWLSNAWSPLVVVLCIALGLWIWRADTVGANDAKINKWG